MPNFEIQNWKAGLDTRRYELTSVPGSLETFVNGHVNQGGEVEKRKSIVRDGIPSLTYGFQETTTSIVVFGSRDILGWTIGSTTALGAGASAQWLFSIDTGGHTPPAVGDPITVAGSSLSGANGNWTVLSWVPGVGTSGQITVNAPNAAGNANPDTGTIVPRFDSPLVFQQLTHPAEVGIQPTMTGVTASRYFNGKTFAVTTWSNGDVLVFYGSTLLPDFYVGLQGPLESTPYGMAQDLVAEVNAAGNYTATIAALANLFFLVTGTASGTINVQYKFQIQQQLTPFLATNQANLGTVNVTVNNNNATASALATAITNATDTYAGGPGTNLGFVGSTPGAANTVSIAPPSGVQAGDQLIVTVTGLATVFVPTLSATFFVNSIPTQTSSKPFTVAQVLQNVNQTFKLISTGTPATAGENAVGQFTIYGGTSNNAATATITQSGQPTAGQTLTLGTFVYKFVSVLTGAANEVLLGSSAAATLANLANAINGATGAGTTYGYPTVANTAASAALTSATVITLTASVGGTPGNATVLSTTASNYVVVAFAGGGPNTNGISGITVAGIQLLASAVQFNNSQNQTASDVVAAINNFSGTSGFNASASQNVVSIMSNATGTTYNNSVVIVSTTGNVVTANCHFVIAPLAGQNVSSITVGASNVNLLTTPLTYQDAGHATESVVQFLNRISANINAYTATSTYLSWVDTVNQALWISSQANSSADSTSNISVTSTAVISGSAISLLKANGNFASQVVPGNLSGAGTSSNPYRVSFSMPSNAVISATGGITPYKYTWVVSNEPTNPTTTVSFAINDFTNPQQAISGSFVFAVGSTLPPAISLLLVGTVNDSSPTPQGFSVVFQITILT